MQFYFTKTEKNDKIVSDYGGFMLSKIKEDKSKCLEQNNLWTVIPQLHT